MPAHIVIVHNEPAFLDAVCAALSANGKSVSAYSDAMQALDALEGVTTTDVNLRPGASVANGPIGLAESGSKVKVLSADNNWVEVQIVEHARPKTDPYSSDRGWVNKRYVKFD